jgi:hypothetical protein
MRTPGVKRSPLLWTLLSAVLLLAVPPAQAQSNGEGTIYSRFGLGTLLDFSSSQSQAMGGGGYALRSLNYNPDANPALWSDQVYTRLSAGASYRSTSVEDGSGNSGRLTSSNVQAIQLSFPLYERTLGVGLSFQPYSRFNYSAALSGSERVGPEARETEFKTTFSGTGGLHRLRGGLGYRINDVLSVGASANLLFGVIESRRRTTWSNPPVPLRDAVVSNGVQLSGLTGTLGGHLANPRWTFVLDGLFDPWSTFSSSFSGGTGTGLDRFPLGGAGTLTDRWRLSTGAEVVPAGEDKLAGYFAQVAYQFGGYVKQLYVQPDGQTTLHEFAATAGLSLPTSLSGTRIDLNTIVGTRGTTSDSLVRDTVIGVSLHVNFGERWFQRRKLR